MDVLFDRHFIDRPETILRNFGAKTELLYCSLHGRNILDVVLYELASLFNGTRLV